MAKRNTKAGRRLRQLKTHQRQLKEKLRDKLLNFEQSLQQQLYGQAFYYQALINLLASEEQPDSDTLIGAMVYQHWLQTTGKQLHHQLAKTRQALL